jgi:hypothetical protein
MTDRNSPIFFAIAQSVLGPNMILMMSFIRRVESVGISRRCRERVCHLRAPLRHLLHPLSPMGSVPRRPMATGRASRFGVGTMGIVIAAAS